VHPGKTLDRLQLDQQFSVDDDVRAKAPDDYQILKWIGMSF
jgi:hypothetical protein